MPTYAHICTDDSCNNEWEDFYSTTKEPPTTCPKCSKETAKRVICGTNRGTVELYGQDLLNKIKGDAKQLQADASRSEKLYSNLLGEGQYEKLQRKIDRRGK